MKKSVMLKWVKALRSGKYKQGKRGELKSSTGYCCLGVLCEVMNKKFEYNENYEKYCIKGSEEYEVLPTFIQKLAGLKSDIGELPAITSFVSSLADLNDGNNLKKVRRVGFKRLAKIIEKCWEQL